MSTEDEMTNLALYIQCPTCESFAWCVTRSGRRAVTLHATRVEPVRQAWLRGYHSGEADTLRSVPATRAAQAS